MPKFVAQTSAGRARPKDTGGATTNVRRDVEFHKKLELVKYVLHYDAQKHAVVN